MKNTQRTTDYFPLSVAEAQAFCNRTEEIEILQTYIGLSEDD